MSSYYCRFICTFARIAQSLDNLTCKGAVFKWYAECEEALKQCFNHPTVLAIPSFDVDFTLETDASIQGLGAV